MNFKDMNKDEHLKLCSKGGKTTQERNKAKDKNFSDVVKENITNKELSELYEGLLSNAKKGNVKAIELILKYLNNDKEIESSVEELFNLNI